MVIITPTFLANALGQTGAKEGAKPIRQFHGEPTASAALATSAALANLATWELGGQWKPCYASARRKRRKTLWTTQLWLPSRKRPPAIASAAKHLRAGLYAAKGAGGGWRDLFDQDHSAHKALSSNLWFLRRRFRLGVVAMLCQR